MHNLTTLRDSHRSHPGSIDVYEQLTSSTNQRAVSRKGWELASADPLRCLLPTPAGCAPLRQHASRAHLWRQPRRLVRPCRRFNCCTSITAWSSATLGCIAIEGGLSSAGTRACRRSHASMQRYAWRRPLRLR